jgi:hypothetical protein
LNPRPPGCKPGVHTKLNYRPTQTHERKHKLNSFDKYKTMKGNAAHANKFKEPLLWKRVFQNPLAERSLSEDMMRIFCSTR